VFDKLYFVFVICCLQLTEYIYSTHSQFNNCSVVIACQVTVNNRHPKWPSSNQSTHGHFWSWTVAHFHRSRWDCEWSDAHKKCIGILFLNFPLEPNTLFFGTQQPPVGQGLFIHEVSTSHLTTYHNR